jgi:hypothetical protein
MRETNYCLQACEDWLRTWLQRYPSVKFLNYKPLSSELRYISFAPTRFPTERQKGGA